MAQTLDLSCSAMDKLDTDETQVPNDSHESVEFGDPIAALLYQNELGEDDCELPIYAGKELWIGRSDDGKCTFVIPDPRVSKNHFRIYSVIYDKEKCDEIQPLIYCEDLESTNGTYINGTCNGIIGTECMGYLLNHGDMIEIKPDWRFRFHQPGHESTSPHNDQELEDMEHFSDRYTVSDRVLGQGQYGAVYLATSRTSSKQVACKIMNLGAAAESLVEHKTAVPRLAWRSKTDRSKEGINMVMREITILSKLSHPNIIDLKKTFCSNTHLYIFAELGPAGDLFSFVDAHNGKLDDLQSKVISRQIVLAIQYIHNQGIAHRDIKPENVLIMQMSFGGRVVLTDFGFANYSHPSSGRLLSRLGTTGYIAPEVDAVDDMGVTSLGYTTSADMWSLGVLTACLLTGFFKVPREEFGQLSQQDMADRYLDNHDDRTKEAWERISSAGSDFLRSLLEINPMKRLTADQALQHRWFTQPANQAALLVEGYNRVIRSWEKRSELEQVMEDLPRRITSPSDENRSSRRPKVRKKNFDASSSPYFGLDRHLQQKEASNRRHILEEVNNSGARFLTSEVLRKVAASNKSPHRKRHLDIEHVNGRDIFGSSPALPRVEECDEEDEVSLVKVRTPRLEKHFGNLNDAEVLQTRDQDTAEISSQKRVRIVSETASEHALNDEVSKSMPKYSSAKALKDEVMKRRLEREMAKLRARHASALESDSVEMGSRSLSRLREVRQCN